MKYARVVGRAFQHDRVNAGRSAFDIDDAQGHEAERHHVLFERPAAIRLLGVTGKGARGTLRERMDAILKPETMAGSPDADATRSASRHLAHGFLFLRRLFFRKLMKEDRNVQYSFSRNRLGWTTSQA